MTERPPHRTRVLLLGGSTEARELSERLFADRRVQCVLSLAGRTRAPARLPVVTRVGGFGGLDGLASYLTANAIDVVVDATHPFAARMSANAIGACARTGVALIAIERAPWLAASGDDWTHYDSADAAIDALPAAPVRVFSGLGRQSLGALSRAPQHYYVVRVVDPIADADRPQNAAIVVARGPFQTDDDIELFRRHRVDVVLAKNAGGDAAVSKIEAARKLGLKVHMVSRPYIPSRPMVRTVEEALQRLATHHGSPAQRGV